MKNFPYNIIARIKKIVFIIIAIFYKLILKATIYITSINFKLEDINLIEYT